MGRETERISRYSFIFADALAAATGGGGDRLYAENNQNPHPASG